MNCRMQQRGPNAEGTWLDTDSGMTLGHRRLSIVDLSENGAQPMLSHDGRYVLVYNGEIYNAGEIRDKLAATTKTTKFRGTSDTEVLLEAVCAYGLEATLTLCTGMFALALFDRKTKKISLARDRVGEKPLYYGHIEKTFVFASDSAVFGAIDEFHKELDQTALNQYLRYGFVPAPLSIYKGIKKCMPGHIISLEFPYEEETDTAYYDLQKEYQSAVTNPFEGSFTEAVDKLDTTLRTAVKSQMMADVPLGAFLSGGIDSATVVAMMQSQSSEKVKTFTIGFDDEKYDEAPFAAEIAKHLGTDHTSLVISEKELQEVVPQIADIFAEPFADSSLIPTYLVSRLAKSRVTVSLSGDAGDELFCGYNTYYKVEELYHKLEKIPNPLRTIGGNICGTPLLQKNNTFYRGGKCLAAENIAQLHEAVCYDMTYFTKRLLTASKTEPIVTPLLKLPENCENNGLADEMMLRDLLQYHPDDILVKVDRAGMAVSLENRVPMLDKDVLKLAFSLPVSYKYYIQNGHGISKRVLKEVLYRYVPRVLLDRPKKGFSVPIGKWMTEGSVHELADELFRNSRLVKDGIVHGDVLMCLWNHFLKTGQNKSLVFRMLVLEQWYRKNRME